MVVWHGAQDTGHWIPASCTGHPILELMPMVAQRKLQALQDTRHGGGGEGGGGGDDGGGYLPQRRGWWTQEDSLPMTLGTIRAI